MDKLTFDEIRRKGLLLFEYVRGSKLYHTDTTESDEDHGGVFISPADFDFAVQDEVQDERGDEKWWELGKFMKLAMTSNPAVIEAFFVPDDMVLYEHPLFREIRNHRNEFLTKAAFKPFGSYAKSQIEKARGQNKKIHWEMEDMKRLTPLDFCYTFDGRQGSTGIQGWLDRHGLRQDCCGLVNLSNMKDCYLMYYDFAQHLRLTGTTMKEEFEKGTDFSKFAYKHFEKEMFERSGFSGGDRNELVKNYLYNRTETPLGGHCGIINQEGSSNTVRLCSTQKEESPICMMTYNMDAYTSHCKKYKEYEEWKAKRNKARYESNISAEKTGDPELMYDCKNMYHSFRNVAMCIEIARGQGLLLDRSGIDRDFLMYVRNRKFRYSELMEKLSRMAAEMDEACRTSTIPDEIDPEMVSRLTREVRRAFAAGAPWKKPDDPAVKRALAVNHKLAVLDILVSKLGIKKEDVMLTGSVAMSLHGILPAGHDIEDVDIIVHGDSVLDRDLETWAKVTTGDQGWERNEKRFDGITHRPFRVKLHGVVFDIWVQDPKVPFDSSIKTTGGYRLATVKHIIDVKKKFGRKKDGTDIIDIGAGLLGGFDGKSAGY